MKTIIIAHNYSEVSFSVMSYQLAHFFANEGHRVIFISHHPYFKGFRKIKKGQSEVIVCSWPTEKRPTDLKDFFWYAKIHLKYKPDVVIGHFVGSNISITVSAVLSLGKTKTIEYYHTLSNQLKTDHRLSYLRRQLLIVRKKMFYHLFCDLLVCPSDVAQKDLIKIFSVSKITIVLNPMIDRFVSNKSKNDDEIIISYLGRLDISKGVLDLVEAFVAYKNQNKQSKMILNIAGTGSQEKEIINRMNGTADINFIGGIDYSKVDAYLSNSHYTIIPSKHDAFNSVGIESMMNQTPLLISNTTGLAYYLTEGKDCYKFEATVEGMVNLFVKVEKKHHHCNEMGVNARNIFLQKFSIDSYCNVFYKLIT